MEIKNTIIFKPTPAVDGVPVEFIVRQYSTAASIPHGAYNLETLEAIVATLKMMKEARNAAVATMESKTES